MEQSLGMPNAGQNICADEAARIRLAAHAATPADTLCDLARDGAVTVRAAVAMNAAAPKDADLTLSQDQDERVRIFVAQRLARLLPTLPLAGHRALQDHVLMVLDRLVQDSATRVRGAIADAVKTMPEAPRNLILQLAHDHAVLVSDPILRLSPVLTDADLLAVLATPPHPAAPASVAQRPNLSATLTDAVIAHADSRAIRALLTNASATLRDATLDAIVSHAQAGPGSRIPSLSTATARALDEIVQSGFLQSLMHPAAPGGAALAPAIGAALQSRIAAIVAPPARAPLSEIELIRAIRHLHAAGALTEDAIADAARHGDYRRVTVQLAVASGLPVCVIDRAAALHSAKGLISIVWLARMPMRLAVLVQSALGQCSPAQSMAPGAAGTFPMTEEEMRWQLDLLRR